MKLKYILYVIHVLSFENLLVRLDPRKGSHQLALHIMSPRMTKHPLSEIKKNDQKFSLGFSLMHVKCFTTCYVMYNCSIMSCQMQCNIFSHVVSQKVQFVMLYHEYKMSSQVMSSVTNKQYNLFCHVFSCCVMSNAVQPTFPSYSCLSNTSGAIYAGVPTVDFGCECNTEDCKYKIKKIIIFFFIKSTKTHEPNKTNGKICYL